METEEQKRSPIWKRIDGILDRVFVVLGVFLFSQFPMFVQQYTQRLAGHLDEVRWYLQRLEAIAVEHGMAITSYVQQFVKSSEPLMVSQGHLMEEMVERSHRLGQALEQLQSASLFTKPWVFFRYVDFSIAKNAFQQFEPGFVTSLEGIIYALVGLLFGYLFYQGLRGGILRLHQGIFTSLGRKTVKGG